MIVLKKKKDAPWTHLASSGLDHELSGQMGGGLGLQRPDHDTLVQGVSGYDLQQKPPASSAADNN